MSLLMNYHIIWKPQCFTDPEPYKWLLRKTLSDRDYINRNPGIHRNHEVYTSLCPGSGALQLSPRIADHLMHESAICDSLETPWAVSTLLAVAIHGAS